MITIVEITGRKPPEEKPHVERVVYEAYTGLGEMRTTRLFACYALVYGKYLFVGKGLTMRQAYESFTEGAPGARLARKYVSYVFNQKGTA